MSLSPETIKRQVDREGARWNVFGVVRDGKCFAAANGKTSESHGGVATLADDPILICEVSEAHPFALYLAHRERRGERDVMKRFRDAAERRKRAEADQYDAMAQPRKDKMRWMIDRPIKVSMPR